MVDHPWTVTKWCICCGSHLLLLKILSYQFWLCLEHNLQQRQITKNLVWRFSPKTWIHTNTTDTSTPNQQLNMILTSVASNGSTTKISGSTALRLLRSCRASFRSLRTALIMLFLVASSNESAPPFVVVPNVIKAFLSPSLLPSTASSALTAWQEKSLDISSKLLQRGRKASDLDLKLATYCNQTLSTWLTDRILVLFGLVQESCRSFLRWQKACLFFFLSHSLFRIKVWKSTEFWGRNISSH